MGETLNEVGGLSRFVADQESMRESMELLADMQIPPETSLLDFTLVTTQLLSEQLGVDAIGRQEYERRVTSAFEYGIVKLDVVPNNAGLLTQLLDVYLVANRNLLFDLDARGNALSERGLARVAQSWDAENMAIRQP